MNEDSMCAIEIWEPIELYISRNLSPSKYIDWSSLKLVRGASRYKFHDLFPSKF